MPTTCADLVRQHARAWILAALARACQSGLSGVERLRAISARQVERAVLDPRLRLTIAAWAIANRPPDLAELTPLIERSVAPLTRPSFITSNELARAVVGAHADAIIQDSAIVEHAWSVARKTLSLYEMHSLCDLIDAVDIVAGLHGPWGEIRSLSNPSFPGFVALGVNAPVAIIVEQAVHESMHVAVAARLAIDTGCGRLCDEAVGVLSPFTDTVRTVERAVHGLLSYGVVLAWWKRLLEHRVHSALIGIDDQRRARALCERRVEALTARIALGALALRDAAGDDALDFASHMFEELSGCPAAWRWLPQEPRQTIVERAGWSTELTGLSLIQRAEALLAVRGHKISRISVPLLESGPKGFGILGFGAVSASAWAVRPVHDNRLNGFSNVAIESVPVLEATSNDEVHLYIANSPELARLAAILDRSDEAGELFGIPACCRARFAQRWPFVREKGGDVFYDMLQANLNGDSVDVAIECDASAMYRGGGLCWHFPCSPRCENTIELVRTRRRQLAEYDAALLGDLEAALASIVSLRASGGYEVAMRNPGTQSVGQIVRFVRSGVQEW